MSNLQCSYNFVFVRFGVLLPTFRLYLLLWLFAFCVPFFFLPTFCEPFSVWSFLVVFESRPPAAFPPLSGPLPPWLFFCSAIQPEGKRRRCFYSFRCSVCLSLCLPVWWFFILRAISSVRAHIYMHTHTQQNAAAAGHAVCGEKGEGKGKREGGRKRPQGGLEK